MFKGKRRVATEEVRPEATESSVNAADDTTQQTEPVVHKIAVLDADEAPVQLDVATKPVQPVAPESVEEAPVTETQTPAIDTEPKGAPPVEPEMLKVLHIPGETNPAERPSHREIADDIDDEDDWDEWDDDDYDDESPLPFGKRALRGLRNAVISVVILAAVLVGAGAAYTYFMGGSGDVPTPTPVAATVTDPTVGMVKPRKPSSKVPESASIQFLDSPVKRGGAVSLSVKTLPGSSCTVIIDHDHVAIPVAGLKKKTADDFGTVNWGWTMPKTAPTGSSTVTVNCAYSGRSAMVQGDLIVQ